MREAWRTSALWQTQRLRGVGLGHPLNGRLGDPFLPHRLEERHHAIRVQRIIGLPEIGGENEGRRTECSNQDQGRQTNKP